MKFRICNAGALLGLTLALFLSGAAAAPQVTWKLSLWGKPRAFTSGIEAFAKKIADETDGRFQIELYYHEQLANSRENLDGLKQNAFEAAAVCSMYHPAKNPAWMVMSLPFLPLGDPAVGHYVHAKILDHPIVEAELAAWNALAYTPLLPPNQEFVGRGMPPTSLGHWRGRRVRASGGLAAAMELLGAQIVDLTAGEAGAAFRDGAVDAVAFPYSYAHVAYGTANHAHWFTSNLAVHPAGCGLFFNKTAYEGLPASYKKMLSDNRGIVSEVNQAAFAAADARNIPEFESTMTRIVYSEAQLVEFQQIAGTPLWDAWIAENKDEFDAQAVFNAVWTYVEEAKSR